MKAWIWWGLGMVSVIGGVWMGSLIAVLVGGYAIYKAPFKEMHNEL